MSRSELARRLGKTKGYITQLLDGRANMTVRTISDVFAALDCAVHFQEGPLDAVIGAAPLEFNDVDPAWAEQECPWSRAVEIRYGARASGGKLAV